MTSWLIRALCTLSGDAWIIFISGSSGVPKVVAVTHRSAAAFPATVAARGTLTRLPPHVDPDRARVRRGDHHLASGVREADAPADRGVWRDHNGLPCDLPQLVQW